MAVKGGAYALWRGALALVLRSGHATGNGRVAQCAGSAELVHPEIRLRDLALGHGGQRAFENLNLTLAAGSLTAVVGANGAGKTTLLMGLMGLLRPLQGQVECPLPSRHMAYLSQVHAINREVPICVKDFVALGLWNQIGSLRAVGASAQPRVAKAVAALGLQDLENAWISDLSGGQFQRVRFARLLVQDCPVVLLDEPFAGIDAPTVQALMRLIVRWHGEGKMVVAVLHDLELVRRHFPHTLLLAGSNSGWGPTDQVLPQLQRITRTALAEESGGSA